MPEQKPKKQRLLILFAHPNLHRSEVNSRLLDAAKGLDNITLVDLYREYPTYMIDVDVEQQRLRDHDVIGFMFPLYWYSTPAILKEWQDLVLEYGFAYGQDGNRLRGKTFFCAITAGGTEKAYHADGYNHFTIRELLQPIEQMAGLTGMRYLPPFALFDARTAADEGRLETHLAQWRQLLAALIEDRLTTTYPNDAHTINPYLEQLEENPA